MPCPNCHGKGYFEVPMGGTKVAVECDHMVPNPNCTKCDGAGYTTAFGMNFECDCKVPFEEKA